MATKNTLADLQFAQMFLDYTARRGATQESRARAKILLATINMLDVKHPQWREDLISELDRRDLSKSVEKMFPLPEVDTDQLFKDFLHSVTKGE